MALSIEQKKAVVAEVAEMAGKAFAAVAAEYRGLTVEEMTELRAQARKDGHINRFGELDLTGSFQNFERFINCVRFLRLDLLPD